MNEIEVPVVINLSHIHLTTHDMEELGIQELKPVKELSQIPNYESDIVVDVEGLKLNVIGPCRFYSQIELTQTDADKLGIKPPTRSDGRLWECPMLKVKYSDKEIEVPVIRMKRRLFIDKNDAAMYGVKSKEHYMGYINKGFRKGVMGNIESSVEKGAKLELHIDSDDANAFELSNGDTVVLRKDIQEMFVEHDGYEYIDEYITNI